MSLSIGVASGPDHAANPRELVACAEVAMMTAKARGKGQIVVFEEAARSAPTTASRPRPAEFRSIAHLKMLHGVSTKLSRLNDVAEIGATIADELRLLIDYHNCRVFVRDGDDLRPIAFRGDLSASGSAMDVLQTKVGDGITGHVALTGEPFLTGDAANCGIGVHIQGTATIEESLLAVPLRYGATVVGVIVVSKLGLDQFDADDLRLLEVLAGHVSVALVNARLYEAQRREAESAKALLELSTRAVGSDGPRRRARAGRQRNLADHGVAALLDLAADGRRRSRLPRERSGIPPTPVRSGRRSRERPSIGSTLRASAPFVMTAAETQHLARSAGRELDPIPHAVAMFRLDQGVAALAVAIETSIGARELELLGGIASQARLAITNAGSFATLERTFLSTVEALANALEAKDSYTSSHARWICDMAIEVGPRARSRRGSAQARSSSARSSTTSGRSGSLPRSS